MGAYPSMQRDDAFLRAWRDTATRDSEPEDDDRQRPPLHFRTLWISDLHLGTPGCQARALLDFLKSEPQSSGTVRRKPRLPKAGRNKESSRRRPRVKTRRD